VRALRSRLPERAVWYSSPEPKALGTARLLTESEVTVVHDLREHERHTTGWMDDFDAVVRRAFDSPDVPAHAGWAPLEDCRRRVVVAALEILERHPDGDVVLSATPRPGPCSPPL